MLQKSNKIPFLLGLLPQSEKLYNTLLLRFISQSQNHIMLKIYVSSTRTTTNILATHEWESCDESNEVVI